jgi:hypothetical protein
MAPLGIRAQQWLPRSTDLPIVAGLDTRGGGDEALDVQKKRSADRATPGMNAGDAERSPLNPLEQAGLHPVQETRHDSEVTRHTTWTMKPDPANTTADVETS